MLAACQTDTLARSCSSSSLPSRASFRSTAGLLVNLEALYGWSPLSRSPASLVRPCESSSAHAKYSTLRHRTIAIGGVLGYLINMYQDHLYHRVAIRTGRKPEPEARLYCASVAAFVFPFGEPCSLRFDMYISVDREDVERADAVPWRAGILMYAWTGRPGVNPAAPIVALAIVFTSCVISPPLYPPSDSCPSPSHSRSSAEGNALLFPQHLHHLQRGLQRPCRHLREVQQ